MDMIPMQREPIVVKFTSISMFHLRNNVCTSVEAGKHRLYVDPLYKNLCVSTLTLYNCTLQSVFTYTHNAHTIQAIYATYTYKHRVHSTHAGIYINIHTTNETHTQDT